MPRSTGVDAFFSGSIFRKDRKVVIAMKYELAIIQGVRLAPRVGGSDYTAGEVLGVYSSAAGSLQGSYANYSNSGGSGLDTAAAVLLDDVINQTDSTSAEYVPLARACFGGLLFKDKLVGYDSAAGVDLGAKVFAAADGVNILSF